MNPQDVQKPDQPTLASPPSQVPAEAKPASPKSTRPQNKAPIGIITFAIIVALGLAAVAYSLYRMDRQPTTSTTGQANTTPATTQDVDDTSQAVDTASNPTDEAPSDTSLSDQTLGL